MRKRVTRRPDTLPRPAKRMRATEWSCGCRTLPRQVVERERDQCGRLRTGCGVGAAPDAGVWRMSEIRVFLGSG